MDTTTLQHHRVAIAACTTIAAAASVWYLIYSTRGNVNHEDGGSSLHRSDAVRRRPEARAQPAGADGDDPTLQELIGNTEELLHDTGRVVDAAEANLDGVAPANPFAPLSPTARADDDETEQDADESSPSEPSPEQHRLQKLAYQIAKHNHDRQGLVHHGVTCDECNQFPIKGPRYHCNNCPDFDLCENCEAKDNHLRTHTFTKVKIPAPWGGKEPQPVWYPGRPHKMPSTLDTSEHRQWRASLGQKYDTLLHEVDGLYLQFTCMANTPLPGDAIGWAIDRAAFNHSFDHQVMTDRISSPSLIRERLFAFYDANGDGLINFEEFLSATSIIHTKDAGKRLKRVFKGLDLNNDGYVSRKDCQQIFRSYYELNREVLRGYLEVDRFAENAILVQAGHDPRDHIASGRSLANYFNGGWPMSGPNDDFAPMIPERKMTDANGDLVPSSNNVTTVRTDADTVDHLPLHMIESGFHLNLDAVLHDEIARLSRDPPQAGRLLTSDQVRGFNDKVVERDRIVVEKFKQHRGELWVADTLSAQMPRRTAYLKVEQEDLAQFSTMNDEDQKCQTTMLAVSAVVRSRLRDNLHYAIRESGAEKTIKREEREKVGLEAAQAEALEDYGYDFETREWKTRDLPIDMTVGGSGAAHTIYLTLHDAMNELLDPLFQDAEALALEVEQTAEERKKHMQLIQQYFRDLLEQRWNPHMTRKFDNDDDGLLQDNRKSAKLRLKLKKQQKQRLKRGGGVGASMADAYLRIRSLNLGTTSPDTSDDAGWNCIDWGLGLEAEIALETRAHERKKAETANDAETWKGKTQGTQSRNPDYDPTMPQFKPESLSNASEDAPSTITACFTPTGDHEAPSPERLHHLAMFEAVARRALGKTGSLHLLAFEELLTQTDSEGATLLDWISGWLDLVNF